MKKHLFSFLIFLSIFAWNDLIATSMGGDTMGFITITTHTKNIIFSPAAGDSIIKDSTYMDTSVQSSSGNISVAIQQSYGYINAGNVTFNNIPMVIADSAYMLDTPAVDTVSVSLDSPFTAYFNVAGSGSLSGFLDTFQVKMPKKIQLSHLDSFIHKTSGYTVSLTDSIQYADTLYFLIFDQNGHSVIKKTNGNAMSCTFSSTDLDTFNYASSGSGSILPVSLYVIATNYKKKKEQNGMYVYYMDQRIFSNDIMMLKF